jgi:signal transduction histidine kinase
MANTRILVADDSRDIAAFLQAYLVQQGYEVQVAYDGDTAVRLFNAQPFDLVLTDLQMPRLNGLGVLHRVKERVKETQVIILTGHASLDTALDALRHGAFDYLLKPVDNVDQLQFAIDRALLHRSLELDNRRLLEELRETNTHLEQKVAEQTRELREAYEQLKSADRIKSEFVSVVSHELRTPLSVMLLAGQMLALDPDGLPPDARREHLDNLQKYGRRLKRLVENLLDFSLLERGQLELELGNVDLGGIVSETIEIYQPRAQEKGLTLQAALPATPLTVRADSARLANALGNLVDNALKFTPSGGRVIVGAHGPLQPAGGQSPQALIAVADTGIGIPPEHQRVLFKAFSQADMSDRRRFEGIGLGLALANRIVMAHGGRITLKSEPGKGSTFVMWLPLEQPG